MSGGFRSRSTKGDRPRKNTNQQRKQGGEHRLRDAGVDKPRLVAFEVLQRVTNDDAYANLVLPTLLRERNITDRDAAFATEITYGTLRTVGVLDTVIQACSSRPLEQIQDDVLNAVRLGAYQLLYTRVEPHAAVDTTVRLVEASGNEKAKGFANAVMRTITRTPASQWIAKVSPSGELEEIAFRHAHPEWIARSFHAVLGMDELEDALAAGSARPIVHLVARPGEISAQELALITGGEEGPWSPYAVHLQSGNPGELEPVRQGMAAVQDEGSQMVARAVANAEVEGEDTGRWLDLCAGPGGKAALLGAVARIEGAHVDAVDVSAHRAKLTEKAVGDLPVTVHTADGRDPGLSGGYDRVLVDAPCSGLGSLRRRPEARWKKDESDIAELNTLQFELLESALNLVRPGGVVIYSTCSPDLRETRGIVNRAVAELGATEIDAQGLVAPMDNLGDGKSAQMWPHRHGTDAMFVAALRRGEDNDDS